MRPLLDDLLGAVVSGRAGRLRLGDQQRSELRDPDGQLALYVLRRLLVARLSLYADRRGSEQPFR